jgi:hypothetical protein
MEEIPFLPHVGVEARDGNTKTEWPVHPQGKRLGSMVLCIRLSISKTNPKKHTYQWKGQEIHLPLARARTNPSASRSLSVPFHDMGTTSLFCLYLQTR